MPPSPRHTVEMRKFLDLWQSSQTFEEASDKIIAAGLSDSPLNVRRRASYMRIWWCTIEKVKYLPSKYRKAQRRLPDLDIRKPVKFNYDKTDRTLS